MVRQWRPDSADGMLHGRLMTNQCCAIKVRGRGQKLEAKAKWSQDQDRGYEAERGQYVLEALTSAPLFVVL